MKTSIAPFAALAVLGAAGLGLAACGERATGTAPANSEVGAAMPDTTVKPGSDPLMTAPDAGATGAVPAQGQPAVGPVEPAAPPRK